ncbi:MAG: SWIB/MDM2 domain-containing protein [Gemmatimonadaceae bacterium]
MTTEKRKPSRSNLPPVVPSEALAGVIGSHARPRTAVVADLWAYIRAHGLQDTKNRRMINPDAALGAVLGSEPISMFEMTKRVSAHLTKCAAE